MSEWGFFYQLMSCYSVTTVPESAKSQEEIRKI